MHAVLHVLGAVLVLPYAGLAALFLLIDEVARAKGLLAMLVAGVMLVMVGGAARLQAALGPRASQKTEAPPVETVGAKADFLLARTRAAESGQPSVYQGQALTRAGVWK